MLKYLISRGRCDLSFELKNNEGLTPLDIAKFYGYSEIQLLLENERAISGDGASVFKLDTLEEDDLQRYIIIMVN